MEIRTQIRNNAGGVYNHRFYFNGLSKEHGQKPQGELAEAIDRQYGSYEKFKEEFTGAALSVFGSGYAWLVTDPQGKLKNAHNGKSGYTACRKSCTGISH